MWTKLSVLSPRNSIILFILLILSSLYFTFQIRFSFNFEDFFPKGDDDLDFFYEFREKFEHDDNFFIIGFEQKTGILTPQFVASLDSATTQLLNTKHIESAISLSNFRYAIRSPFGYIDYPALHMEDSSRLETDKQKLREDERVMGKLVNEDFTIATIVLKIKDSLSQPESELLVATIHEILAMNSLQNNHMLGKAYFQVELVKQQITEFLLYSIASILLVALVSFLIFRKWVTVLICLFNVLISMLLFLGFSGLTGVPFNAMSVLYPIVIIIVGISDVMHLLTGYIFELKKDVEPKQALLKTRKEIGFATFLTAITTAIGFLTLVSSKVEPIRNFGLMSAAGVFIAYLVTFYFTGNILHLIKPNKILNQNQSENKRWNQLIHFFYTTGILKKRLVIMILIAVILLASIGTSLISTDTHLGYGLPKNSKVSNDYNFFDENFNGFRPFEIAAIAKDSHSITDLKILREIDKVETFIKKFDAVNGVQSTTLIYKSINRANNGDVASAYVLPIDSQTLEIYKQDLKRMSAKSTSILISEDEKYGRITATLTDVGTDSIRKIQTQITDYINRNVDTASVEFVQTGTGIILDKNTLYLRQNLIFGLCFGFIPISLLIAFFYRNWKMFFISSIPNLVPLLICGGIIGLTKIELDAPTSIIFGIIYGIAVDDTIHFLSRFKQEITRGLSTEEAIFVTFNETGKAVFTTTLILFFGFGILMFSSTAATFNIGFLTAVTLLSAAISDVYLLPLLLRNWLGNSKKLIAK